MNHGKNNNTKLDEFFEQFNQKIARLLGKKTSNSKKPSPSPTNNKRFFFMIAFMILTLWGTTSIYFLDKNIYAIIMVKGKISQVVKGARVGFILPYPLGTIKTINGNPSALLDIGKIQTPNNIAIFNALTQELDQVNIQGKFSYQVVDPLKLFTHHIINNNEQTTNEWVKSLTEAVINNYIANLTTQSLMHQGAVILSNELREKINEHLDSYGLKIVKLRIDNLDFDKSLNTEVQASQTSTALGCKLGENLLIEASNYQKDTISKTLKNINQFLYLENLYDKNPESAKLELSENLKSQNSNQPQYHLLKLNLSEVVQLGCNYTESLSLEGRQRHFNREVRRGRGHI